MSLSNDLNDKKIKEFLFLDRLSEGIGFNKPKEGQKFYYSSEFLGDHTENWIQIIQNGKIISIINPLDCAIINFEE